MLADGTGDQFQHLTASSSQMLLTELFSALPYSSRKQCHGFRGQRTKVTVAILKAMR